MQLTPEKILDFTLQAQLEISPDQAALWSTQMNEILTYLDQLSVVDTAQVEPMSTPLERPCVLRPDQEHKEFTREDLLSTASHTQDGYFTVPRMI